MGGLSAALCLSWALALVGTHPLGHDSHRTAGTWHHLGSELAANSTEVTQRCADEEGFDAVTLDEAGTMVFFKGSLVWKGFMGAAEPIGDSWPEIQGPIDAALRIHYNDPQDDIHDNVLLFQGKKLWAYRNGNLRSGYPKLIKEMFPGIPDDLDAAVECHPKECPSETILFFKDPRVFTYDLRTKAVKLRTWPAVSNCTAAVRWLERYYCFQGIHFLRFDPLRGDVPPQYPRDARDYFMRCPGRGHGGESRRNATLWSILNACSGRPFSAFSSDDPGRIYAFRGGHYFRVDSVRDGLHAWLLNHTWSGLEGEVDAAFSWADKLYFIQDSQVTIYRSEHGYIRVEGYPRPLLEELGVSQADAAFTCPHSSVLYIIQGNHLLLIDLHQSPRRPGPARLIPHPRVDSAICTTKGVFLFVGADFHQYQDVAQLSAATVPAPAQNTAAVLFRCSPSGAPQHSPPDGHRPRDTPQ
ncbi:hemopexin isoform X1 [Crotalus tigris]|uniref:hemopexin isoform X1 n=1 Tax=Crotalus tigris TaxID=88082 RepID=UPI00192F59CE|nr:hemopexin isoform X1 [Crotalus tigris]